MRRITAPLNPGDRNDAVANLQDALRLLIERERITLDSAERDGLLDNGMPLLERIVAGQVASSTQRPLPSVAVTAFHVDGAHAIRLGEDNADAEGRYVEHPNMRQMMYWGSQSHVSAKSSQFDSAYFQRETTHDLD